MLERSGCVSHAGAGIVLLVACLFALPVAAQPPADGAKRVMQAGVAVLDITPALGGSLAGGMTDRTSQRVHDPLHARCLVLDNGQARLALVICDVIVLRKQEVDRAKQLIEQHTCIPPSNVLVAAIHTHTGPTTAGVFQSEPDPAYLDWLVVRMADAVRCAVANLQPCRVGWGAGQEPSVLFNRRYFMKPGTMPPGPFEQTTDQVKMNPGCEDANVLEPAGPTDPQIGLLAVQCADGKPMALVGNYALHYVGWNPGTDLSADYFGMWAETMTRRVGACCPDPNIERPAFLAILTNGCSADVNNMDVRHCLKQPYPYHQMRQVAEKVAAAAFEAFNQIEYRDWVPLGAKLATLDLAVRKPDAAAVKRAERILAESKAPLTTLPQIYARETVLLAKWPEKVTTMVQAMRVGDLGIATFPGEAFVELGLEVKAKSPFKTMLCVELANDYAGYIPSARAHELGGYETWPARSAFLEKPAAAKMVATALQLLGELAG